MSCCRMRRRARQILRFDRMPPREQGIVLDFLEWEDVQIRDPFPLNCPKGSKHMPHEDWRRTVTSWMIIFGNGKRLDTHQLQKPPQVQYGVQVPGRDDQALR